MVDCCRNIIPVCIVALYCRLIEFDHFCRRHSIARIVLSRYSKSLSPYNQWEQLVRFVLVHLEHLQDTVKLRVKLDKGLLVDKYLIKIKYFFFRLILRLLFNGNLTFDYYYRITVLCSFLSFNEIHNLCFHKVLRMIFNYSNILLKYV